MNQKKIVFYLFVFFLGLSLIMFTGEIKAQKVSSVDNNIEWLKFIHVKLTDINGKEEMMREWLNDVYSGYPDLVKVLLEAVKCPEGGCHVKGPFLPLDVIEGSCREARGKPNEVIMDNNQTEVVEAYIRVWKVKNSYFPPEKLTLDQILKGK